MANEKRKSAEESIGDKESEATLRVNPISEAINRENREKHVELMTK